MDILLIEDNDHRRVTFLKGLLSCGHRVTPCSSTEEAEEMLRFLSPREAPPDAVVIAGELMSEGGLELQRELDARFNSIRWIALSAGRDVPSLARELERPGLNIVLVYRRLEAANDTLAGTLRPPTTEPQSLPVPA